MPSQTARHECELWAQYLVNKARRRLARAGTDWDDLSGSQRSDAAAVELSSFLEGITPERWIDLFGTGPALPVIQKLIRHTRQLAP